MPLKSPSKRKPTGRKRLVSPKLGRPSKYQPQYGDQLIEHMRQGFSFESFGAIIGSHRDTLYEWAKVHEPFSDAKKRAVGEGLLFYEKVGLAGMTGKLKGFNPAAWIFSMKNRFQWQDRVEIEQYSTERHIIVTDDGKQESFEI